MCIMLIYSKMKNVKLSNSAQHILCIFSVHAKQKFQKKIKGLGRGSALAFDSFYSRSVQRRRPLG